MRSSDWRSGSLISYVNREARIRSDHPLWIVQQLTDEALAALSGSLAALCAVRMGHTLNPSEMLLRALLLQGF